jgi:molybdopterin/thiamine biosynthesis adenylyltransferase
VLDLFRNLTVAVIGCGSVGGRIALLLARMGIGTLLLIDPKKTKTRSLATHEIGPDEVDQPKALVFGRRCKAINPAMRVLAFVGPVEALELSVLAGVNLFVMAPDLLRAEAVAGQICLWLGRTLVHVAVHGATLTVQIRVFSNSKGGATGCPVCGYGRVELDLLTRQVRFCCEGTDNAAVPASPDAPATNSLSALCSLAADLAVIQILRLLLNAGQEPVADTMLEYCGFNHRTVITPITRNPKCSLEHSAFAQVTIDAPLHTFSLAQLVQRATGSGLVSDAQFEIAGFNWVERAACHCSQPTSVRRFVPRGRKEIGACRACTAPLVPLDFYTHRVVGASLLGAAVEQPLNRLGARRVASALIRTAEAGVLVRPQPSNSATP